MPTNLRQVAVWLDPRSRRSASFVVGSYRKLVGRRPGLGQTARWVAQLAGGRSKGEVLLEMARSDAYVSRVMAELPMGPELSDEEFVRELYLRLLDRPADADGAAYYVGQLHAGAPRSEPAATLIRCDEHVHRVAAAVFGLPNLRAQEPARYLEVPTERGERVWVRRCRTPRDFDELEGAILRNGYYEKPGIWSFELNQDKRVVAELIAALEPSRVLEIGCSNGTVLQCLAAAGIRAEGLEISRSAIALADPSVRDSIHLGDLLEVRLDGGYDVVYGLDVFEHLNPNRLGDYLARIVELVRPGGFVVANVPAYGTDSVFGTVFPRELPDWEPDAAAGRTFSLLPVDGDGYPHHGHLIWAESSWWVRQFEQAGLRREPSLEQPLHARYDAFYTMAGPARLAFYVFSRQATPDAVVELAGRIERGASALV